MNKNYIKSLVVAACIPLCLTGCSSKENSNTQLEQNQEQEQEVSAYKKEEEIGKKYGAMVKEDLSNINEIAQKYLKEVFGEETEVVKEPLSLSNHTESYLRLKSNPKISFEVHFYEDDKELYSTHENIINSNIVADKFNSEFSDLLPEGAKIYIEVQKIAGVEIEENETIDELINQKKLNIIHAGLYIPTNKEEEDVDYEEYRELILKFSDTIDRAGNSYMDIVFMKDNSHLDAMQTYYSDEVYDYEMPEILCSMMDILKHSSLYKYDKDGGKEYLEVINNTFQGKIHAEFNTSLERDLTKDGKEVPVKSIIIDNPLKDQTDSI